MGSLEDSIRKQIEYKEGKLFWKSHSNSTLIGKECGHDAKIGYRVLKFNSKNYLAHRIVWLLNNNSWPPEGKMLDHINGDTLDNRIENLRLVNYGQNALNKKFYANNKSGARGVHWDAQSKKWKAQIKFNKKVKSLGRFDTVEEASEVYELASDMLFGKYKRGAS